jgi:hypothetical protein
MILEKTTWAIIIFIFGFLFGMWFCTARFYDGAFKRGWDAGYEYGKHFQDVTYKIYSHE